MFIFRWDESVAVCGHESRPGLHHFSYYQKRRAQAIMQEAEAYCLEGSTPCRLGGPCVDINQLCDGLMDCPGGEDEALAVCAVIRKNEIDHIGINGGQRNSDRIYESTDKNHNHQETIMEHPELESSTFSETSALPETTSELSKTTISSDSVTDDYNYEYKFGFDEDEYQRGSENLDSFDQVFLSANNSSDKIESENIDDINLQASTKTPSLKNTKSESQNPSNVQQIEQNTNHGIYEVTSPKIQIISCADDEFDCGGGWCVPSFWLCDGHFDCQEGEDEDPKLCDPAFSTTTISPVSPSSITPTMLPCTLEEWRCPTGHCIPQEFFCDGVLDCPEGYDEVTGCSFSDIMDYDDYPTDYEYDYDLDQPTKSPPTKTPVTNRETTTQGNLDKSDSVGVPETSTSKVFETTIDDLLETDITPTISNTIKPLEGHGFVMKPSHKVPEEGIDKKSDADEGNLSSTTIVHTSDEEKDGLHVIVPKLVTPSSQSTQSVTSDMTEVGDNSFINEKTTIPELGTSISESNEMDSHSIFPTTEKSSPNVAPSAEFDQRVENPRKTDDILRSTKNSKTTTVKVPERGHDVTTYSETIETTLQPSTRLYNIMPNLAGHVLHEMSKVSSGLRNSLYSNNSEQELNFSDDIILTDKQKELEPIGSSASRGDEFSDMNKSDVIPTKTTLSHHLSEKPRVISTASTIAHVSTESKENILVYSQKNTKSNTDQDVPEKIDSNLSEKHSTSQPLSKEIESFSEIQYTENPDKTTSETNQTLSQEFSESDGDKTNNEKQRHINNSPEFRITVIPSETNSRTSNSEPSINVPQGSISNAKIYEIPIQTNGFLKKVTSHYNSPIHRIEQNSPTNSQKEEKQEIPQQHPPFFQTSISSSFSHSANPTVTIAASTNKDGQVVFTTQFSGVPAALSASESSPVSANNLPVNPPIYSSIPNNQVKPNLINTQINMNNYFFGNNGPPSSDISTTGKESKSVHLQKNIPNNAQNYTILIAVNGGPDASKIPSFKIQDNSGKEFDYEVVSVINQSSAEKAISSSDDLKKSAEYNPALISSLKSNVKKNSFDTNEGKNNVHLEEVSATRGLEYKSIDPEFDENLQSKVTQKNKKKLISDVKPKKSTEKQKHRMEEIVIVHKNVSNRNNSSKSRDPDDVYDGEYFIGNKDLGVYQYDIFKDDGNGSTVRVNPHQYHESFTSERNIEIPTSQEPNIEVTLEETLSFYDQNNFTSSKPSEFSTNKSTSTLTDSLDSTTLGLEELDQKQNQQEVFHPVTQSVDEKMINVTDMFDEPTVSKNEEITKRSISSKNKDDYESKMNETYIDVVEYFPGHQEYLRAPDPNEANSLFKEGTRQLVIASFLLVIFSMIDGY